jgi:hypothetical protein
VSIYLYCCRNAFTVLVKYYRVQLTLQVQVQVHVDFGSIGYRVMYIDEVHVLV